MMEEETTPPEDILRPEEMVPFVREYLGLLEDIQVIDEEVKRCFMEYKVRREKLMAKKKPMDDRFHKIEDIIKRTIHHRKLPGIKYKHFIFTLEPKKLYKRPEDKIIDALERNPIENYTHDRKTLARLIADAVKKKCRSVSSSERHECQNMILRIRELR
jgi:hypothetical protein